jgi:hypothetical protein
MNRFLIQREKRSFLDHGLSKIPTIFFSKEGSVFEIIFFSRNFLNNFHLYFIKIQLNIENLALQINNELFDEEFKKLSNMQEIKHPHKISFVTYKAYLKQYNNNIVKLKGLNLQYNILLKAKERSSSFVSSVLL